MYLLKSFYNEILDVSHYEIIGLFLSVFISVLYMCICVCICVYIDVYTMHILYVWN